MIGVERSSATVPKARSAERSDASERFPRTRGSQNQRSSYLKETTKQKKEWYPEHDLNHDDQQKAPVARFDDRRKAKFGDSAEGTISRTQ
jgi:hypothetical protein